MRRSTESPDMDSFSPNWLALREPADIAARSASLVSIIGARLATRGLRALDLATGTGSNARYLAGRLPGDQEWLLVDHDPALLSTLRQSMTGWAAGRGCDVAEAEGGILIRGRAATHRFSTRALDLAGMDDPDLFAGRTLVTASALLDLVSEQWLMSLAAGAASAGADVLFALSYDGRLRCSPEDRDDEEVRGLVNVHQRRDKGFGPALGPDAPRRAAEILLSAGYRVHREQSDWVLPATAVDLQAQLVQGWARAACEQAPDLSAAIRRWETRRIAHVAAGCSTIVVGHEDVAGALGA